MIDMGNIIAIDLVDVAVKHEDNGLFTFGLTYYVTYKDGKIEKIVVPRVENPFYRCNLDIHNDPCTSAYALPEKYIDTKSCCKVREFTDTKNDISYHLLREVIKEPDPVEMTMDEIEAALGKRIKIVNKGDKK